MNESNARKIMMPAVGEQPTTIPAPSRDVLTEILRDGAQRLLGRAIEAEVGDWIERHGSLTDDRGRQEVVRNGHHPPRTLVTGVGPVAVTQPRVLDRRIVGQDQDGQDVDGAGRPVTRFSSKILPPYLRKTKALEELIPWLYLKGVNPVNAGRLVLRSTSASKPYFQSSHHGIGNVVVSKRIAVRVGFAGHLLNGPLPLVVFAPVIIHRRCVKNG